MVRRSNLMSIAVRTIIHCRRRRWWEEGEGLRKIHNKLLDGHKHRVHWHNRFISNTFRNNRTASNIFNSNTNNFHLINMLHTINNINSCIRALDVFTPDITLDLHEEEAHCCEIGKINVFILSLTCYFLSPLVLYFW